MQLGFVSRNIIIIHRRLQKGIMLKEANLICDDKIKGKVIQLAMKKEKTKISLIVMSP